MALGSIVCRHRHYNKQISQLQHVFCSTGPPHSAINDVPNVYKPSETEERVLEKWKRMKKANNGSTTSVFRMLLPPPNVTGKLHVGHFLTIAVEDTIARWKLMTGIDVDWIPGFDHAGIATQSVVNRKLAKSGSLGKSDVLSDLEKFSAHNFEKIKTQLQATGAMLNWDEAYYTLDGKHSSVVKEAFIQLFDSGLIRRADGIVNWSCTLKTTVADIEVENIPFESKMSIRVPNYKFPVNFGVLYHVAYKFLDSDQNIIIATSRPETIFGDVALGVNPEDSRYASLIGNRVINPLTGAVIPIIGDARVKPDFGTGVIKITPAHDKLDFAIGSTQNLNAVTIFTSDGHLNENCGNFKGLPRFVGRREVLKDLEQKQAVHDEKPYTGSIGICSRSGDVIEPMLLPHWFLQTQFLSNKLIEAIQDKSFVIVPENHSCSLVQKIMDSQDWCLSRQIQWGHQIPAFYHKQHPDKWVAAGDLDLAVTKLEKLLGIQIKNSDEVIKDSDVLDTWFSSALIPLAVSGWPDSENFKEITLMETGHDILLFWVWRMTIMTLALVNRFPFRHVLLHGIVTDHFGRKMSKSRGNVIDPIHIINGISYKELVEEADKAFASGELEENEYSLRKLSLQQNHPDGFPVCGTDALRLSLLSQNIFDQEVTLDLKYLDTCKRFSNKLWQALRFLKLHSGGVEKTSHKMSDDATELTSRWILSCLYEFNKTAEMALNQAKFHLYAEAIRKFFYQELCDIYIELIKSEMQSGEDITKSIVVMQYVFEIGVKTAHPLIPFVTEEIWSHLKNDKASCLLEQDFPTSKSLEQFCNPNLITSMAKSVKIAREIRSVKKRSGCTKSTQPVFVEIDKGWQNELLELQDCISKLSGSTVTFEKCPDEDRKLYSSYVVDVTGTIFRIHVPMMGEAVQLVSVTKIEKLKLKLLKLQQTFDSPSFQQFAPPEAKEKLKKRVARLIMQLQENDNPSNPKPS